MHNRHENLFDAMRACGLEPPDHFQHVGVNRFPGIGKGPTNRAGWCVIFSDSRGACFGDFSSGLNETWQDPQLAHISSNYITRFAMNARAAKAQAKMELNAKHRKAGKRARHIWDNSRPLAQPHPYTVRKLIAKHHYHNCRTYRSTLTVRVTDFANNLTSLQFIAEDGQKWLLKGGRVSGCFIPATPLCVEPPQIIICEGWATACTLVDDNPHAMVLAAISCGNLKPVAVGARKRWPYSSIIIAGDDDRQTAGNPGATMAHEAAAACDGLVALPDWPDDAPGSLTDFNDLAVHSAQTWEQP